MINRNLCETKLKRSIRGCFNNSSITSIHNKSSNGKSKKVINIVDKDSYNCKCIIQSLYYSKPVPLNAQH